MRVVAARPRSGLAADTPVPKETLRDLRTGHCGRRCPGQKRWAGMGGTTSCQAASSLMTCPGSGRRAGPPLRERQPTLGGGAVSRWLALVGCQAIPSGSTSANSPTGDGVVVGGIDYCSGLPTTVARNPGFVAGAVAALSGTMSYRPESGRVTDDVLPTHKVDSQTVAVRQECRLVLTPGPHVLVGHYANGGSVEPWVAVLVRLGKQTRQNIPNECK